MRLLISPFVMRLGLLAGSPAAGSGGVEIVNFTLLAGGSAATCGIVAKTRLEGGSDPLTIAEAAELSGSTPAAAAAEEVPISWAIAGAEGAAGAGDAASRTTRTGGEMAMGDAAL